MTLKQSKKDSSQKWEETLKFISIMREDLWDLKNLKQMDLKNEIRIKNLFPLIRDNLLSLNNLKWNSLRNERGL